MADALDLGSSSDRSESSSLSACTNISRSTTPLLEGQQPAPAESPDGDAEPVVGWHENGVIRVQGWLLNGKPAGEWREFHSSGFPASVTHYRGGRRHGSSHSWYRDGEPKAVRQFVSGVEQGLRLIWYRDGIHWREEYRDGVRHGQWQAWRNGVLRISGGFASGEMEGRWQEWDSAGRLIAVTVWQAGRWTGGKRPEGGPPYLRKLR